MPKLKVQDLKQGDLLKPNGLFQQSFNIPLNNIKQVEFINQTFTANNTKSAIKVKLTGINKGRHLEVPYIKRWRTNENLSYRSVTVGFTFIVNLNHFERYDPTIDEKKIEQEWNDEEFII